MFPDQGVQDYTQQEAETLAGADPDAFTRDLFNSIASGNYPSWTVYAQTVELKDVASFPVNIFDPTRRWPTDAAPLRRFAKITLNENVQDAFGEIEQASFSPAAIVPGWDVSADPSKSPRIHNSFELGADFFFLFFFFSPNSPSSPSFHLRLSRAVSTHHQFPSAQSQQATL